MEKAWQHLTSKQTSMRTKAHGTIALRSDLDDLFPYISTQVCVLNGMIFPEPIYVLIVRRDGSAFGTHSWVQTPITFANHMAKARTLRYTWTLHLASCKESDCDVLGALRHSTLSKIQKIIDTGYIVLRTYYVRARVMISGDSPWLRHLLGMSTYFGVGIVYSFATYGVTRMFHVTQWPQINATVVQSWCNCLARVARADPQRQNEIKR